MTSTGVGNSLPCALVECSLKILQASAFGQVGQTCLLQGTSLGGFSCDGSTQGIHVPAAKFLSLQRVEWLGLVLFVVSCGVASVACSTIKERSQGDCGARRPSIFPPLDHCYRTRMQSLRSQSTDRTSRREIRRARLPQLGWWPIGEPPRASPIAEASTGPSACAGGRPGGWMMEEPTDTGSTVAAAEHRGHMRENASHRGRGAHQRRVEPHGATRSRRR